MIPKQHFENISKQKHYYANNQQTNKPKKLRKIERAIMFLK